MGLSYMAFTEHLGFSDLPNIYNITFPVGPDMPNVRDDVLLVQTLMKLANFDCPYENDSFVETSRSINVDGWFGEQTQRMIKAFEIVVCEKHLRLVANGVIEPSANDGYTARGTIYKIIHLNQLARLATQSEREYDQISSDPRTHPTLRQSLSQPRDFPINRELIAGTWSQEVLFGKPSLPDDAIQAIFPALHSNLET